ncbi:MAG: hypothetical protein WCY00_00285 [Candidatus Dojkabacteria bacterium]|jgi:hypothetical protein
MDPEIGNSREDETPSEGNISTPIPEESSDSNLIRSAVDIAMAGGPRPMEEQQDTPDETNTAIPEESSDPNLIRSAIDIAMAGGPRPMEGQQDTPDETNTAIPEESSDSNLIRSAVDIALTGDPRPMEEQQDTPEQDISNQTEQINTVIVERANALVPLSQEEKKEIEEAGKTNNGYFATIKRMFSGQRWKGLVSQIGISVAGSLAVAKGTGLAIATLGPAGAIGAGAIMLGLGGYTAYKVYEGMKISAKEQGKTVSELIKDKGFLKGVATGLAVSGLMKGGAGMLLPALIPGVGPALPIAMVVGSTAIEIGMQAKLESDLNKKQQELLDSYLNSFEQRRYNKLKNLGYVKREGIDISKVISDIQDPNLSPDEVKTAQKTAIAALNYLYKQTGDPKYKYVHYTEKDNQGNDIRKEVDITNIGFRDLPTSTQEYPMEEIIGINIESFIDTLDNEELINLTSEAWNNSAEDDRKKLAVEIITKFVSLEATDVENLLSNERSTYFDLVNKTLGIKTGNTLANLTFTSIAAGKLIHSGVGQIEIQKNQNLVRDQYRNALNNQNANVSQYKDHTGRDVNLIDLDGDGAADLVHVPNTNEFYAKNTVGAEKLFEIQNPGFGKVSVSEFTGSNTGIMGTIVGQQGEVVGIIHSDSSGNLSIMNQSQLTGALKASMSDGSTASMSISNIQANGDTVVQINGTAHNINLAQLSSIPGSESISVTEGTPSSSIIKVETGDSVPSLLDKILTVAKEYNPNMQGEKHELQNFLYRDGGGHNINDANIRTEFGLNNPVQPAEQFEITNSPTVMRWLQQLNNGLPVNFPASSPGQTITQSSPGINFNFEATVDSIDLTTLVDTTPNLTLNTLGITSSLAIASLFPAKEGRIIRETILSIPELNVEIPKPEPVDPLLEEYTREILITQVFGKDYTDKNYKFMPNGQIFIMGNHSFTLTNLGWFMDSQPIEIEDLVDTLLSQENDTKIEVLTNVLDNISSADGQRGRRRINLFPHGNNGGFQKVQSGIKENSTWVEWGTMKPIEEREIITSRVLAQRILRIKEEEAGSFVGNIPLDEEITSSEQSYQSSTPEQVLEDSPFTQGEIAYGIHTLESDDAERILDKVIIEGDLYQGKTLTAEILREKGLSPKYRINMENSVIWLSSSAYRIMGNRLAVVAYVEQEDKVYARSYYLSNSSATWRLLPYYSLDPNDNSSIGWYGKGWSEESLGLPIPISKALSEITKDENSILAIDDAEFVFAGTARLGTKYNQVNNTESEKYSYYQEINENPRELKNFPYTTGSNEKVPPEELVLTEEESPNYSNLIDTWSQRSLFYGGEVTVEVYPSNDNSLRYTLYKDTKGRVWIGGIHEEGNITSTGLHRNWIKGGDLITPAFEYESQAEGYGNPGLRNGLYVDMYENYISKIPIIQEYLRYKGNFTDGDSASSEQSEHEQPEQKYDPFWGFNKDSSDPIEQQSYNFLETVRNLPIQILAKLLDNGPSSLTEAEKIFLIRKQRSQFKDWRKVYINILKRAHPDLNTTSTTEQHEEGEKLTYILHAFYSIINDAN